MKRVDEFELHARYQKYVKKKRKEHEKKKRTMNEYSFDDLEMDAEALSEDEDVVKNFTAEQIVRMKTEHMSFIAKRIQKEKKKIEGLTVTLHLLGEITGKYRRLDRYNKEVRKKNLRGGKSDEDLRRKIDAHDKLKVRKNRLSELEQMYTDLRLQKELGKKGKKRKMRCDELVSDELRFPEPKSVYKWRQERKR